MRLSELSFRGRAAIVTGGGSGIGREIGLGIARLGGRVCFADMDPDKAESAAAESRAGGSESIAVRVDVTRADDVDRMVGAAREAFGTVDVLVNNAGGASGPSFRIGRVCKLSEQDWDDTFAVNLKSVFLCTRAVAPLMLAQERGSIVNMASLTGQFPFPGLPAYSAAKAAVISLTQSLAMELAPHVRVNALAPGLIETPRTSLNRRPEQLGQLLSNVPLARMGSPEEVADMALYLASDAAAFISGTVMDCAGGQMWLTRDGRPAFRDLDRAD
ncbi:3-oxoacyl-[acyl-carrier-protein] reductase FabG [Pigmentiphaga humi]|uniref:3-oxoacyl-[acyl-carrier-protein] reductase FabG n=1 Tax=Pigmentiphaga humi TaxID=2478468 RepID=A0A3P4AXA1_9BURK|nr:SDR family NAD(P)-dependent oxidoreductase [Pigmentiphaga humi]VCU68657.1 3-oxoacyl-[acyl-carrier-protein] reductase FabG [Pigmentiphaga humi]